jgi:hypothetical protein
VVSFPPSYARRLRVARTNRPGACLLTVCPHSLCEAEISPRDISAELLLCYKRGAMARKIIHVDMDCFYAAVEVKHNPELRGKPLGVGGRADSRGVLCTASYEARKFGVRSAMPSATAKRLCPQLILVPPHFELYKKESYAVHSIFERFTKTIEPLSLDEAYLDRRNSISPRARESPLTNSWRKWPAIGTNPTANS